MEDAPAILTAIDALLVEDEERLACLLAQTDAVHAAHADLMRRLRLEIEGKALAAGAGHLRG